MSAAYVPPGHYAIVVGNERVVMIDFMRFFLDGIFFEIWIKQKEKRMFPMAACYFTVTVPFIHGCIMHM
jgi:hypothetical protein